jgi:hypothetical protein
VRIDTEAGGNESVWIPHYEPLVDPELPARIDNELARLENAAEPELHSLAPVRMTAMKG